MAFIVAWHNLTLCPDLEVADINVLADICEDLPKPGDLMVLGHQPHCFKSILVKGVLARGEVHVEELSVLDGNWEYTYNSSSQSEIYTAFPACRVQPGCIKTVSMENAQQDRNIRERKHCCAWRTGNCWSLSLPKVLRCKDLGKIMRMRH